MLGPMEIPRETCLLSGCGYTGARLARRLAPPVLGLVRTGASVAALAQARIPALAVDLDGGEPLPLPDRLGAVAYLAPPGGSGSQDERLRHFLASLGPVRPRSVLYLSTTAVYGDTAGAPADEDAPAAPGDTRARQRLDAEGQIRAWCGAREIRWAVFRVGAIYGPFRLPLDRLRRGEPVLREEDTGPGNRIHVDDLVAACAAVLEGPAEGIFNLVDGVPWSPAAFADRVAFHAGLPRPPRIGRSEAEPRLGPAYLSFFRERRRVVSSRLAGLGVVPRTPEAGIRDSLREMGLESPGA